MTHYEICLRSAKALTPNEFESRWNNQANYDRLHEDAKMGGSFNRDIIAAFFSADWNNKPRLVRAFPEIFLP
jgi:hypothetical protein